MVVAVALSIMFRRGCSCYRSILTTCVVWITLGLPLISEFHGASILLADAVFLTTREYSGFDRFPAFYFGAAENGTNQSQQQLGFVRQHAMAGWGWQQGFQASSHNGEQMGEEAVTALTETNSDGVGPDLLFVYRQSESIFTYYSLMEHVEVNRTLLQAAQLHDPSNDSIHCGGGGLLGFTDPLFVKYWIEDVANEIANERHVSAVFFDGFDKLYAGNTLVSAGCPGFTSSDIASELQNKVAATAKFAEILNQHQSIPILSTYNYLEAAISSVYGGDRNEALYNMNGVYEDTYLAALKNHSWMRFYEVWLGHGAEQDAVQVANAIMETSLGIPFIARSDPRLFNDLNYPACAFLVAQDEFCYFGVSTGWLDPDWVWHPQYTWKVGKPLGRANRTSTYKWTRQMTNATLTLDVETASCIAVIDTKN